MQYSGLKMLLIFNEIQLTKYFNPVSKDKTCLYLNLNDR